jgi:aspartyl-tRNA synthetase
LDADLQQNLQRYTDNSWVFNQMKNMSLEEKIGQLFIIRAQSNWKKKDVDYLENIIKKYHVGGLAFFKGTAKKQLELTNRYQKLSKTPLFLLLMQSGV